MFYFTSSIIETKERSEMTAHEFIFSYPRMDKMLEISKVIDICLAIFVRGLPDMLITAHAKYSHDSVGRS